MAEPDGIDVCASGEQCERACGRLVSIELSLLCEEWG